MLKHVKIKIKNNNKIKKMKKDNKKKKDEKKALITALQSTIIKNSQRTKFL